MKAIVLKCKPGSRFHFGKYAPDADTALNDSDEIMHSDTLFAALVNTYNETFGDAQELVDAFAAGNIKISSLMYCLEQDKNYTWFLPKPISFNLFEAKDYKNFRGIKYISKQVWESIENPAELANNEQYKLAANNLFCISSGELKMPETGLSEEEKTEELKAFSFYHIITLPKVSVRDNEGIYQLTVAEIADNHELAPGSNIHYYFLMEETEKFDRAIAGKLQNVIELLPYTGIGAERSTIGNIESVEMIENWKIEIPEDKQDKMFSASVSLFSPTEADINKMIYYKTIMRGGRRLGIKSDPEKKYLKSVRMVCEGAILHKDCEGTLADISPADDKTYLRCGKAISLPVRSPWIPAI